MAKEQMYDLIVVGGGPAGLSAAINAESERLNTLVLDSANQLGGQAGTSSLIENYPGFPGGVSGQQLTSLMIDQALQFNTEFVAPWRAARIETTDECLVVHDDSESVLGRTVLVSTGVEYRRLVVPNLAAYFGRGVTYGSPRLSETYQNQNIYIIGGANSAGQAAMHLSKFEGCHIHIIIRGISIEEKMSSYLSDRILFAENIEVHTESEVVAVDGDGQLRELTIQSGRQAQTVPADHLFVLIGAAPKTAWLPERVARDKLGFVQAGSDIESSVRCEFVDTVGRSPFTHESSVPGLFIAGDVRSMTTKRVASAVGDGATTVPDIHRYLATLKT